MNDTVKVGFAVAYDWQLLAFSIPRIYRDADKIYLFIDKKRVSWSGNPYAWNQADFDRMIAAMDELHKIEVVEETFYLPHLDPGHNETRQRKRMFELMGSNGWHLQLDCDEYILDFAGFVKQLQAVQRQEGDRINVCCPMLHLYKQVSGGFLAVDPVYRFNVEYFPMATWGIAYDTGRRHDGVGRIVTDFLVLHQSWARTVGELKTKISNWGHSDETDKQQFLAKWQVLNGSNFRQYRSFHPLYPELWQKLKLLPETSISSLIEHLPAHRYFQFPKDPFFLAKAAFEQVYMLLKIQYRIKRLYWMYWKENCKRRKLLSEHYTGLTKKP